MLWLATLVHLSSSITLIPLPTVCAFLTWCVCIKNFFFFLIIRWIRGSRASIVSVAHRHRRKSELSERSWSISTGRPAFCKGLQRAAAVQPLRKRSRRNPLWDQPGAGAGGPGGNIMVCVHRKGQAGSSWCLLGVLWGALKELMEQRKPCRGWAGISAALLEHSCSFPWLAGINNWVQMRNKPAITEIRQGLPLTLPGSHSAVQKRQRFYLVGYPISQEIKVGDIFHLLYKCSHFLQWQ